MRSTWAALGFVFVLAACADPPEPDTGSNDALPWAVADCGLDAQATGWDEGNVLPDFSLENQFGSRSSMHDFCDRWVLVQVTNYW